MNKHLPTCFKFGLAGNIFFVLFGIICMIYYAAFGDTNVIVLPIEFAAYTCEVLGFIFIILTFVWFSRYLRHRLIMKISFSFYILMELILISCLVIIACYDDPVTVSDLTYSDVIFETCTPNPDDESDLHLTASGEQMYYELRYYESTLQSPELFMERFRKGDSFQVGFTTAEKADPPFHILYEIIGSDDTVHLTLESMNVHYTIGVIGMYAVFPR